MSLSGLEVEAINKLIVEHNRLAHYVIRVSDMIRTFEHPWYIRLYMWIRPIPFPSGRPHFVPLIHQDSIVPVPGYAKNIRHVDTISPFIDNEDDVTHLFSLSKEEA